MMRAAFKSASAYLSLRSMAVIGRLHERHAGKGNVFIDYGERIRDKFGELPTKRLPDHAGIVDLNEIYGGYYEEAVAVAAFDHKKVGLAMNLPVMISLNTFVSITTAADSIYELDTKRGEVAIILAGENAGLIFRQLKLNEKRRRGFGNNGEINTARNFIKRRLRLFSLVPAATQLDDVTGQQPSREAISQQMYASEPKRRIPDQLI